MASIPQIARYILACELLLGGQARLTDLLTPQIREQALAKAAGYQKYLPFIPGTTAVEHSRNIGILMFLAGVGMFLRNRPLRMVATGLGTSLAIMGIYSQSRMGVPFWLPCINTVLGSFVLFQDLSGRMA